LPRSGRWCSLVAFVGLSVISILLLVAQSTQVDAASKPRTEVSVLRSPVYGSILVVGSGVLEGYPLYEFSGDHGTHLGCGTTLAQGYDLGPIASVPLTCTGPMSDALRGNAIDDWPALTSVGAPIADVGVNAKLLGTVARPGIGDQVTYGGHPLYLFDPSSSPFKPQGVDYVETVHPLAPWHGYWSLVSSSNGASVQGPADMETGSVAGGRKVLAVARDVNVRSFAVTVYAMNGGSASRSMCTGTCASEFIPLLTSGSPRARSGVARAALGVMRRAGGVDQVTYDGEPLFLFTSERASLTAKVKLRATGTAGNGDGIVVKGGASFSYVLLKGP
jgi:predicted lipoprotein with Yx(FWY)xxD motif